MISEKSIEKKLREKVVGNGGIALKFTSPGYSGVPDRIVLAPHGKIYFIELKAPSKKKLKRQEKATKALSSLGFEVRMIDSTEKVESFISEIFS